MPIEKGGGHIWAGQGFVSPVKVQRQVDCLLADLTWPRTDFLKRLLFEIYFFQNFLKVRFSVWAWQIIIIMRYVALVTILKSKPIRVIHPHALTHLQEGTTALLEASFYGHLDLVELLLESGAQVDQATHRVTRAERGAMVGCERGVRGRWGVRDGLRQGIVGGGCVRPWDECFDCA